MKRNVKSGLDVLLADKIHLLKGRKIGICCNPTAVDSDFNHCVDRLSHHSDFELVSLFGPEHGLWGSAQDMIFVGDVPRDPKTQLPIYSLYGHEEKSLKPTQQMLEGIDLLLFDIQDIGSRYYTYIYTMSYCMEAAGEAGIEIMVLDRPNPINGIQVEGPLIEKGFESFVGRFPLPNRHGLTSGELATFFQKRMGISCSLSVIPCEGWSRHLWMDQTTLPWVMPSPNMPTLETATVYPGGCLFEGTNLSEARGTTRPFELVGAPFLRPEEWAKKLNSLQLPGVFFRPNFFSPTFHKWGKQECGAVQIHVTNRDLFEPFLTGIAIIQTAFQLSPQDFEWRKEAYEFVDKIPAIDLLFGSDFYRKAIEANLPLHEIKENWQKTQSEFDEIRKEFFLYC